MLLVPAGKPVDGYWKPTTLDKGDILIDGGNTYYRYWPQIYSIIGQRDSLLEWVSGGEKEHDLVLALCLAVIKKPMKGYALSLNP
jgi:6-phosphogluconate dehydrogenase